MSYERLPRDILTVILSNTDLLTGIRISMTSKFCNDLPYLTSYYSTRFSETYKFRYSTTELTKCGYYTSSCISNVIDGNSSNSNTYEIILTPSDHESVKKYVDNMISKGICTRSFLSEGECQSIRDVRCGKLYRVGRRKFAMDIIVTDDPIEFIGSFSLTNLQCYYKDGKIVVLPYSEPEILQHLKSRGIFFSNNTARFVEQVRYKDLMALKSYYVKSTIQPQDAESIKLYTGDKGWKIETLGASSNKSDNDHLFEYISGKWTLARLRQ